LTIPLSLEKRVRKLITNSKGFSSVIGTVFMVLVVMFMSTSVFMWTLSQNTLYNEAVKERNQLEVDRLNEKVKASNTNYTVYSDDKVNVMADLQNLGPLSVHFTTIWAYASSAAWNRYNFSTPSVANLLPGQRLTITTNVTIMGSGSAPWCLFSSWLVTGRGNVVPLEEKEEKEIIIAEVAQGIGAISMDFAAFRYYEPPAGNPPAGAPPLGTDLGSAKYTFIMPSDKWTVFAVKLTNLDRSRKNITLNERSCIWLLSPPTSAGAIKGDTWYITRVVDNKLASFTPRVLKYNTPTTVYFGAWFAKNTANSITAVNILLFGTIGDNDYGQNIPFVSIYVQG